MSRSERDTPEPAEPGGDNPESGLREEDRPADQHGAALTRLSDYHDGLLPEVEAREVDAHLERCADCRAASQELEQTVGALAGLHRMAAPQQFDKAVEETIHRRSAGRFFGRRAFGDRIPLELLAIVALALALAIYGMLRASETGSLAPRSGGDRPVPAESWPQPETGP